MRYLFSLCLVLMIFSGISEAGSVADKHLPAKNTFIMNNDIKKTLCRFPKKALPKKFTIFAAGAYSGRKLGVQIDKSGHEATQIDVLVNYPDRPVVLLLGAYEPTIWDISWTAGTKISAVLASGFHKQAVAGLKPITPTLTEGFDSHGTCGYFYVTPDKLESLVAISQKMFDRPPDSIYFAQQGSVVIGNPQPSDAKWEHSSSIIPSMYYQQEAPLAGKTGLKAALRAGILRQATPADSQAWAERYAQYEFEKEGVPIPRKTPSSPEKMRDNAYVVLKPFTYPSGLYGEDAATFFIPDGVPLPKGNPGNAAIFDFNALH